MPRRLLSLHLKNDVLYPDQRFDFEPGLYLVLGDNRDAAPGSTNAAGKSRFFGALSEVLYDEPVSGKEAKSHSKRDTSTTIDFETHDGARITVVRRTGKHNKLELLRNDKPLKNETLSYSRERLRALWNIGEEEWYTQYYIDPKNRPNPLLRGTTTNRQKYLVDLFNLTGEDVTRRLILAEVRDAEAAAAALAEVRESYANLRKRYAELGPEDGTSLSELRTRHKHLGRSIRVAQRSAELNEFRRDNKDLFLLVRTKDGLGRALRDDLRVTTVLAKRLRLQSSAIRAYRVYQAQAKESRAAAVPIQAAIDKIGLGIERAREGQGKYHEAKAEIKRLQGEQANEKEVEEQEVPEEPKYSADMARAKISALEARLRDHKAFKDGKCPTCGQSVDHVDTADLETQIEKWKSRLKKAKAYDEALNKAKIYQAAKEDREKTRVELARAKATAAKFTGHHEVVKFFSQLPLQPKEVERPATLDEDGDQLEKVIARKTLLERALTVEDKMAEAFDLGKTEIKVSLEDLVAKEEKLSRRINKAEARETLRAELKAQAKELKARGTRLKRVADELPILKVLVKAFSSKGMQKLKIQRYAQFLQKQINKYRRLVFSEDISFEFNYGTQLSFLAHRRYGKRITTSDVRRLSGAETTMLTLLLLVATLSLQPASRRMNFVILDEPTAALGEEAKKSFAKFLPVLLKFIPVVVIITPKSDERYDGAKVYTATKHKGVSKLIPMTNIQ